MSIINQTDLEKFFPDLANFNLTTIQSCIDSAEVDVMNFLHYIWFPNAYSTYVHGHFDTTTNTALLIVPKMDETLLNYDLLKNLFIYRTLGFYLFPSLMKTTIQEEDSFFSRAKYYEEKYAEELSLVTNAPLYDFNKDSTFDNLDVTQGMIGRPIISLHRA